MALKQWMKKCEPLSIYIVLTLTMFYFLLQLVVSYITHALTLTIDSYLMLCNLIALFGCIITIKVKFLRSLKKTNFRSVEFAIFLLLNQFFCVTWPQLGGFAVLRWSNRWNWFIDYCPPLIWLHPFVEDSVFFANLPIFFTIFWMLENYPTIRFQQAERKRALAAQKRLKTTGSLRFGSPIITDCVYATPQYLIKWIFVIDFCHKFDLFDINVKLLIFLDRVF